MAQYQPIFVYIRSFQIQSYSKIVDFSGIRTRNVREHVDHLTTTTAQYGLGLVDTTVRADLLFGQFEFSSFAYIKIVNIFTCLVESQTVKWEVSCIVVLSLTK